MTKPLLDTAQPARLGGVRFPWTDMTIKGTYRHHIHQYRHTNAGSIEKQGRHCWVFNFDIVIDESFASSRIAGGGYDGVLDIPQVFAYWYENGLTQKLTVPLFGDISVIITEFERRATVGVRSGDRMRLELVEDKEALGRIDEFLVNGQANVLAIMPTLKQAIVGANLRPDLIDSLVSIMDSLSSVREQVDGFGERVKARLERIVIACQTLEKATEFQDPLNNPVYEALKELWAAALSLLNVQESSAGSPVATYEVPKLMTVQQLSIAIYGRADRSFDLLSLNAFDDPFSVEQGTLVRYIVEID